MHIYSPAFCLSLVTVFYHTTNLAAAMGHVLGAPYVIDSSAGLSLCELDDAQSRILGTCRSLGNVVVDRELHVCTFQQDAAWRQAPTPTSIGFFYKVLSGPIFSNIDIPAW